MEKSPNSWAEIKSIVETLLGKPGGEVPAAEVAAKPTDDLPALKSAAPLDESTQPQPEAADTPAGADADKAQNAAEPGPASPEQQPGAAMQPIIPVCGHARVLCIDGPGNELELFHNRLSALGVEVTRMHDLEEGFGMCVIDKPHVVVIQMADGGKKLLECLHRFVTHPCTRNFPVIFINHGNEIPVNQLPRSPTFNTFSTPVAWKELYRNLEKIIPIADLQSDDPLAKAASSGSKAEEKPSPGPTAQAETGQERPLKILCIDDDPLIEKSIIARVKPYAIQVKGAANGTAGYLQAISDMPDVILLDLQMPEGDGHYVLAKLKEHPRTKDIPVVMLTVETHQGVRRQMLGLGASGFLTKPMRWQEFFAEIGHHVALPEQLISDYHLSHDAFVMSH